MNIEDITKRYRMKIWQFHWKDERGEVCYQNVASTNLEGAAIAFKKHHGRYSESITQVIVMKDSADLIVAEE